MPIKYSFFDSTADDPREYPAREFAEYFADVLTNGIYNGGETLRVTASGEDGNVSVNLGAAWISGYRAVIYGSPMVMPIEPATTLDRIDRIILRLNTSPGVRKIDLIVLKGNPASNPTPPALTRAGNIYDLSLAQVRAIANTTVIAPGQITDERLNTAVCGLVNSIIRVDTTVMQQQFDTFMAGLASQGFATTDSPTFTGAPKAPTAPVGTNTTQLATTAFVNAEIAADRPLNDYVRQPGYAVTTGAANAYIVTLSPALASYSDGVCLALKFNVTNTGSSTINVNGLGARTLLDGEGNTLAASKLKTNLIYTFRYNTATGNFVLQGEGGGASNGRREVNLFVQTAQPTALIEGDIWIKSSISIGAVYFRETTPTGSFNNNDIWVDISGLQINYLKDTGLFSFVGRTIIPHVLEVTQESGRLITFWDSLVYNMRAVYDRLYRWDTSTSRWLSIESYYWKGGAWNQFSANSAGTQWTAATLSAAFGNRAYHSCVVFDNKIWLIGGQRLSGSTWEDMGDVWYSTDGATWTQAAATGSNIIGYRKQHSTLAYDGKMWVLGGANALDGNFAHTTNAYSTNGTTWTQVTSNIQKYSVPSVVYDNKMWMIGGYDTNGTSVRSAHYSTNGATWTQSSGNIGGTAAIATGQAMIYNNKIFVINLNSVWTFDGASWLFTGNTPSYTSVSAHQTWVFDDKMWTTKVINTTTVETWYSIDGTNGLVWTKAATSVEFGYKPGGQGLVFNNRMWLIGGGNNTGQGSQFDDVYFSF